MASANKLPQITLMFWVLKIAATTLGETGGDLVAQTWKLGYVEATLFFAAVLVVGLLTQLKAKKFHPALYWTVIAATSTMGTTLSDFLNRGPGHGTAQHGIGYAWGALILTSALALVFVIWKFTGQTFNVTNITTFRGELLYWVAIILSNTLGTSSGDFLSDDSGLGFGGAAIVIALTMVVLLALHYFTKVPGMVLFWVAFVLTRPLGATAGDFLSKPLAKGGLGMGPQSPTIVFLVILVLGITYNHFHDKRARTNAELEPLVTADTP